MRLVDADLFGDGEVQGQMQEGVHLPAFRRELLLERSLLVFKQGMVLRMLGDEVDGRRFGAFEDTALPMLAPGGAKELTDLVASWVEHDASRDQVCAAPIRLRTSRSP